MLTPEGGGKRTVPGGVQNPFLGGVSFVRFSTPPPFSTPPSWRPLKIGPGTKIEKIGKLGFSPDFLFLG